MKIAIVITVFMAICLAQTTVSGILCFQCNSINNTDCLNFANYGTKRFSIKPEKCPDSDFGKAFCRKTLLRVFDANKKAQERIIRSCGYVPSHRECYKTDNEGHQEKVCQCFEDNCNSASHTKISMLLFVGLILLINCCS